MKPLNIPKESQEALLNGASMFIMPIDDYSSYCNDTSLIPYQIGDEVYFDEYKATIKDVKVIRIRKLLPEQMLKITGFTQYLFEENGWGMFVDWYNKQYGKYEDNPYVFLYEVKEIK
jgi:hypothetical protein